MPSRRLSFGTCRNFLPHHPSLCLYRPSGSSAARIRYVLLFTHPCRPKEHRVKKVTELSEQTAQSVCHAWWPTRSRWCHSWIDVPSARRREQLLQVLEKPEVPLQNLLTLQHLLRHLEKVCQHAEQNGLDIHTLGQVFGPLLIRGPVSGWAWGFFSCISIGWRQILEIHCWKINRLHFYVFDLKVRGRWGVSCGCSWETSFGENLGTRADSSRWVTGVIFAIVCNSYAFLFTD